MTDIAGLRDERRNLEGELCQRIYDDFVNAQPVYRLGGEEYELGDSELGDPLILIRRSDGVRFEVELDAHVQREPGAEEQAAAAAIHQRLMEQHRAAAAPEGD